MSLPDLSRLTTEIIDTITEAVTEDSSRVEAVNNVLGRLGIDIRTKPDDFDTIFAYTLVLWGVDRSRHQLDFLCRNNVRSAFRETFFKNDPLLPVRVLEVIAAPSEEGESVGDVDFDPRMEFVSFTVVFNQIQHWTKIAGEDGAYPDDQMLRDSIDKVLGELRQLHELDEVQALLLKMYHDREVTAPESANRRDSEVSIKPSSQGLLDAVASDTNLKKAWIKARFYASTSLQYFDQNAYENYEKHLDANLVVLRHALLNGEFQFSPLRVFEIPKGDEVRATYFAEPEDALAEQAIINVVGSLLESVLSDASFGHRLNPHTAESKETFRSWLEQFDQYVKHVRSILEEPDGVWYQITDFANYYPSIDRNVLKGIIAAKVKDVRVLTLLSELLDRQQST